MSILVFIFLAIVCSIVVHRKSASILKPSAAAGVLSGSIFQAIGYLIEGELNSLALVAFVISSAIAFLIAVLIGKSMRVSGTKPAEEDTSD
jgi:uncharacterized membrane protein (UPF0136 family)